MYDIAKAAICQKLSDYALTAFQKIKRAAKTGCNTS